MRTTKFLSNGLLHRLFAVAVVVLFTGQLLSLLCIHTNRHLGPDNPQYLSEVRKFMRAESWDDPRLAGSHALLSPLYLMLVAGLYTAVGESPLTLKLVQFVMFLATVGLSTQVVRLLGFRRHREINRIVVLLSLSSLCWRDAVRGLGYEALLAFLILALLVLVLTIATSKSRSTLGLIGTTVAAGVVAGLGSLAQSKMMLVLVVLGAWLVWHGGRAEAPAGERRRRWALAGLFVATSFLVVSPWTLRNYRVYREFIPVTTQGGISFYMGHNPSAAGKVLRPKDPYYPRPFFSHDSPLQSERAWYELGLRYAAGHPLRTVRQAVLSVYYTLLEPSPSYSHFALKIGARYPWVERAVTVYGYSMTLLMAAVALLGAVVALREQPARGLLVPLLAVAGVFIAIHVVCYGGGRYRIPVVPIMIILQSVGIAWLVDRCGVFAPGAGEAETASAPP